MFEKLFGGKSPDRVERNSSDGQTFYGYDYKNTKRRWLKHFKPLQFMVTTFSRFFLFYRKTSS